MDRLKEGQVFFPGRDVEARRPGAPARAWAVLADAHARHVRSGGEAARPCPLHDGARWSAAGVSGNAVGGAGIAVQCPFW